MMPQYGVGPNYIAKPVRTDMQPLDTCAAAFASTIAFIAAYFCMAFDTRYNNFLVAVIAGVGVPCTIGLLLMLYGILLYRRSRPSTTVVLVGLGVVGGALVGYVLGDRTWWKHTVSYYTYEDMGSYVNVDPGLDVGQSFMDAGTLYFKEGSYVLKRKGLAFHNGDTYCVAPIVRQPVQLARTQSNPFVLDTVTGFVPPRSGTVDWWAVGTNCCGKTGTDEPFTCGDAKSAIARTGLRVLNEHDRSMYLLATQEWSASTGLPVRHPLFFEWVKDPVDRVLMHRSKAGTDFVISIVLVFVGSLIVSLLMGMVLARIKCRSR
eukprot:TRINITY_DN58695_c0_g1_i1.p1 TRINITY_DN58695_c0_g1~~TRINITY_DN58695_c0_g1_i1.p1  ORF type:complete len:351 (-),score=39.63 TRINITY_DN58695_c0_g1_i1:214-1170(-)